MLSVHCAVYRTRQCPIVADKDGKVERIKTVFCRVLAFFPRVYILTNLYFHKYILVVIDSTQALMSKTWGFRHNMALIVSGTMAVTMIGQSANIRDDI